MICSRCAQAIELSAVFCGNCGQPVPINPSMAAFAPTSLIPTTQVPVPSAPSASGVATAPYSASTPMPPATQPPASLGAIPGPSLQIQPLPPAQQVGVQPSLPPQSLSALPPSPASLQASVAQRFLQTQQLQPQVQQQFQPQAQPQFQQQVQPPSLAQAYSNAGYAPAQPVPITNGMPMINGGVAAMPQYAVANPAQHKGETKAMVGVIIAVLGIPGALIPFLGIMLGATGLFLGVTTRQTAKRLVSKLAIIFSVIAIVLSIGAYMFNVYTLNKEADIAGGAAGSQTSNGAVASNADKKAVDTPCYKVFIPKALRVEQAASSCAVKAYEGESLNTTKEFFTVDAFVRKDLTEAAFLNLSETELDKTVKSTLPGFSVTSQKLASFAKSPARVVDASNGKGTTVQIVFMYRPTPNDENFFVVVHASESARANAVSYENSWEWK